MSDTLTQASDSGRLTYDHATAELLVGGQPIPCVSITITDRASYSAAEEAEDIREIERELAHVATATVTLRGGKPWRRFVAEIERRVLRCRIPRSHRRMVVWLRRRR